MGKKALFLLSCVAVLMVMSCSLIQGNATTTTTANSGPLVGTWGAIQGSYWEEISFYSDGTWQQMDYISKAYKELQHGYKGTYTYVNLVLTMYQTAYTAGAEWYSVDTSSSGVYATCVPEITNNQLTLSDDNGTFVYDKQ